MIRKQIDNILLYNACKVLHKTGMVNQRKMAKEKTTPEAGKALPLLAFLCRRR